jgi:hypothetical protein
MNCATCTIGKRIEALWQQAAGGDLPLTDRERDELRAACLKCSNGGETAGLRGGSVHLDAAPDPQLVLREADPDYVARLQHSEETVTPLPPDTEDALRKLLCTLTSLDFQDIGILWGIMRGMTLSEIAVATGAKSKGTVWARLHSLMARCPWTRQIYAHGQVGANTDAKAPAKARKVVNSAI